MASTQTFTMEALSTFLFEIFHNKTFKEYTA